MTENYIVAEESSRKSGKRSTWRLEGGKKERKEREKNLALPSWTRENRRETAFLPVKIIRARVYVRFLWKSKEEGKKRNENVRRGGKRKRKPGNRLDSRKGLSTFSHDTICCRHLTDNASAGAKYVFQLYLFPSVSFSLSRRGLFSLRETARPSRYPASVELRARLFEPRVVLGLVSTASETRKG